MKLIYPLFVCEVTSDNIRDALESQYTSQTSICVDEREMKVIEKIKGREKYCLYELFQSPYSSTWEFVIGIREEDERTGGTIYDFAIKLISQGEIELVNHLLISCGIGPSGEYQEREVLWKNKDFVRACVERAKKILSLGDLDEAAVLLQSKDSEDQLPLDFYYETGTWTVHFEDRIKLSGDLDDDEYDRLQGIIECDRYVPANNWCKSMKDAGAKLLKREIKRLENKLK